MVKASIKLNDKGPCTLDVRGRKFRRGVVQTITDAADVSYFKLRPEFDVTFLSGNVKAVPVKQPKPEPAPEAEAEADEADGNPYTAEKLSAMTRAQLDDLAAELGMELASNLKKAGVVDAILAFLESADDDEDDDEEGDSEDDADEDDDEDAEGE